MRHEQRSVRGQGDGKPDRELTHDEAQALLGFVPADIITKPVKPNRYVQISPPPLRSGDLPVFDGPTFSPEDET